MRNITKNIQLSIDGNPTDFRLTKLDAFSGAELLRMLAKTPAGNGGAEQAVSAAFASLDAGDLRSLMTACLNHTEVLLPAGYQRVMQGGSWGWPDLEHDAMTCLKLAMEEVAWTLEGFFGEGGRSSRPPKTPAGHGGAEQAVSAAFASLDAAELILVRRENEKRAAEAARPE